MGKTIKQVATELNVSKQAVWQRVKRSDELSAMLNDHAQTVNGTIYVDTDLEQRIKEQYPDRPTVDETPINICETVDETTVNVDETAVNSEHTVDETGSAVYANTLIATLQNTVDTLQQQLTAKDNQIDELTTMLKVSQEQQATLVTALSAAQALHAGTIQERLTVQVDSSEEKSDSMTVKENEVSSKSFPKKRGLFARLFGKNDRGK